MKTKNLQHSIPDELILEVSLFLRVVVQMGGEIIEAHLDYYHSGAVVADGGGRVQVRALGLRQWKLWEASRQFDYTLSITN